MRRTSPLKIWESWEEEFLHLSEQKYGFYCPLAGVCIGIIIQSAKDKDLDWLETESFNNCCAVARLDPFFVSTSILNTINYLKLNKDITFSDLGDNI